MAHVVGTGLDAVKAFFSKNYAQLDFFQMARLLSHALQQEGLAQGLEVSPEEWESRLAAVLRVRPTLSLAFPEHDLASIAARSDGKIQVEAGFFGLYGVTSPLPYFYTEGLMQASQQGRTSARGLLDIFHYAAYPLLIKAWTRHRNLTGLQAGLTERQLTRQTSWVGLVGHASRKRTSCALVVYCSSLSEWSAGACELRCAFWRDQSASVCAHAYAGSSASAIMPGARLAPVREPGRFRRHPDRSSKQCINRFARPGRC